MLNELERMSLALDFVPRAEATVLIEALLRRLTNVLGTHIIDVLWRKDVWGGVGLEPYTFVDISRRGGAKYLALPAEIRDDMKVGLWPYVYRRREPVWLEKTKPPGLEPSDVPIINRATNNPIERPYLYVWEETDSIMATPLVFGDSVRGVFCIELAESGKLNEGILDLMRRLSVPLATIIWKSEAHRLNHEHTTNAVKDLIHSINSYSFDEFINPYRAGFFARPFKAESSPVETAIKSEMERHGILARQFVQRPAADTINEIMNQIGRAHFGIADITRSNPNVMLEVGMMIIQNKRLLLLRDIDDTTELPFDTNQYPYFAYSINGEGDALSVSFFRADGTEVPLSSVVEDFLNYLLDKDPAFKNARPFPLPKS